MVSSGLAFNFVSKEIAEDREMVEWYFENGNTDFRYIPDKFRKDKEMIMKYSTKWSDADISLLQDKEVAMHYCRKNEIPSEIICNDLIIEAAKYGQENYFTKDLFSNELVFKLLDYIIPKERGNFSRVIKENEQKLDKKVLKRIAELNPIFALHNLSHDDDDDDIILTKDHVLKYMNEIEDETVKIDSLPYKWRRDRDVAKAALLRNFGNYNDIDQELMTDAEFLKPILEISKVPIYLLFTRDSQFAKFICSNKECLRKMLKRNPSLLCYVPCELDEEFVNSLDFYSCNSTSAEILYNSKYEIYCKVVKRLNSARTNLDERV